MFKTIFKIFSYSLGTSICGGYALSNYQIYQGLNTAGYPVTPHLNLANYAQQVTSPLLRSSQSEVRRAGPVNLELIPLNETNLLGNYGLPNLLYQINSDSWKLRLCERPMGSVSEPSWSIEFIRKTKIE